MRRGTAASLSVAFALLTWNAASADAPSANSGLGLPRYVSLGAEGANGRRGPGLNHRVEWIYQRAGLPLQVTAESGPWRRVRDPDGAEVWMHSQSLTPRRSVYLREDAVLRRTPAPAGRAAAFLGAGVIGALTGCDGDWRRVAVGGRVGWLEVTQVWGADDCSRL